ncbi:MAG TPA: hypothetical protein DCK83_08690 [Gallionellaceae bacterium]|nr:hypothetical protein [Gallionellaceae bacterium]
MSVNLLGVEKPLQLTLDYIDDNQAAKVAEVEARFNAEFSAHQLALAPFAVVTIVDPRDELVIETPMLFVVADQGGEHATRQSFRGFAGVYQFEFAVIALGEDEPKAKRAVWRYLIALWEMLSEMHSASHATEAGSLHWFTGNPTRFFYMPTYTNDAGEIFSDGRLLASVEYRETG